MNNKQNECGFVPLHEEVVEKARDKMPDDDTVFELADLFKVFGDSTRVKILSALVLSEMCVYDISALLCMSQSAVSHQLKTLRNARLVKFRREGKTVYYSLDDEHVHDIFRQGLDHINHTYLPSHTE
jgi:ArsR family transcriptional regulator, lead/cadmium/zinc/bismuth-responsive transcriptional repressor